MPATLPAPTYLSGDLVPRELCGVEIVSVGMRWPASTGETTVTFENIQDAIRAADDPQIQVPRVRLGHLSRLNADMPRHEPFAAIGDAEPAFGRWINLRTTHGGATLVGDIDDIPDWLATGASTHFPSRSMECNWDVTSPSGGHYSMVITAVALLGAYLPACRDLSDLVRLVAGGPDALSTRGEMSHMPDQLSVSQGRIEHAFNFEWAMDPANIFEYDGETIDPYYWWVIDIRVDPLEVIARDESGGLWRASFETDGEFNPTFVQPVPVHETFVDIPSRAPAAASADELLTPVYIEDGTAGERAVALFARRHQRIVATFSERPAKPARSNPPTAASTRPEPEENIMPEVTAEQFARLRALPEDADQATIDAAVAGTEPVPDTPPSVEPPAADPAAPPVPAAPEPVAETARLPAGLRVIDEAMLADLRTKAEAGANLARDTSVKEKADTIASAIREGRIAPARRAAFERMWDADLDGTRHLLTAAPEDGGLEPNAVPTTARSHSTGAGSGGGAFAEVQAKAAELRKTTPTLSDAGAMQAVFRADSALAARYQDEVRAA